MLIALALAALVVIALSVTEPRTPVQTDDAD